MRFVLCIVIAALLPASALAAKGGGSMSLSSAQAAAARGHQGAAAALATMRNRRPIWAGARTVVIRKINALAPAVWACATPAASSRTVW